MLGSLSSHTDNPLLDFSFLYVSPRDTKNFKAHAGTFQISLEAEEPLEAHEEEYMRWLIGSSIDEDFSPREKSSPFPVSNPHNVPFAISSMIGSFVELSTDQRGSRFLQQSLDVASSTEKEIVFREILPSALSLMVHIFGNYVVQKFLDRGTKDQRDLLAESMKGNFLSLSLHTYGCRVVQKALEVISLEKRVGLVSELKGGVSRCIMDQNGNHVLQKIIERVPSELIGFIFDTFVGNTYVLSTHPYGKTCVFLLIVFC
eukprot:TRINITY_DN2156_c0_g1_i3.p1 TRINITY_DN2156_c0_g1~~TRINITY_DN2156_c0_g1_i3.p1  ORF type:complete len:259 (+),score=42.71 TRINITY_DN2156_c0_g1_i3:145-921(+)